MFSPNVEPQATERSARPLRIAVNGWFVGHTTAGSGQYIHHLLTHIPRLPKSVQLLLLVPPEAAEMARTFAGVIPIAQEPPDLPAPLRKLWWEQITVPKAAKLLDVDLLWVPYWAAPAWQPCPVAVTVHDLIPALLPAYRGKLHHRLYTALVSWTARRSASILTVSHASARDITTHLDIPAERVHVVYHGTNQEGTSLPAAAERIAEQDAVRVRYALPERYFLYLGGFDMRKNVDSTLAAYARYLALGGDPAVKLVIAGQLPDVDTPFAPDPRRQAAAHGVNDAVHFCGRVDEQDKAALYAQATAFLFPSLYEGFGMMLLEAMASGTPVITSGEG
jgi:glycosyltransferase involved in cell wall biosynthesis